jgi:transcriptional regulator with XRE-family HTH domain
MPSNNRRPSKRFGVVVREAREAKKVSQLQLAEDSGLSLNFIGLVERGDAAASLESIVKIANGLNLTAAELLRKAGL